MRGIPQRNKKTLPDDVLNLLKEAEPVPKEQVDSQVPEEEDSDDDNDDDDDDNEEFKLS